LSLTLEVLKVTWQEMEIFHQNFYSNHVTHQLVIME